MANRNRTLFIGSLLLVITCASALGQGSTAAMYGKWRVDRRKSVEATRAKDPDAALPIYEESTVCTYTFGSDGKLVAEVESVADGMRGGQTGRWRVLGEGMEGLKIELLLQNEAGVSAKFDAVIRFLDAKTLQLNITGITESFVLVRTLAD